MSHKDLTFDQYLWNRFIKTKIDHEKLGRRFDVTFEQYVKKLQKSRYYQGFLRAFEMYRRTGRCIAHVFAFKNREMMKQGVCSVYTMQWTTRHQQRRKMGMKKGDTHTPETRAKISKAIKGRLVSEATREKISAVRMGTTQSLETRQKMSEAKKGKKQSPEHCEKRRQMWARKREAKLLAAQRVTESVPEVAEKVVPIQSSKKYTKADAILLKINTKVCSDSGYKKLTGMTRSDGIDFRMPFGRYEGDLISKVIRSDPHYIRFLYQDRVLHEAGYQLQQMIVDQIILESKAA